MLLNYLSRQIPGKDEDHIGASLAERLGRLDGQVRTRKEMALLVGAYVHRVVEEVCPDTTIIEKRVPFRGRTIPREGQSAAFDIDQEVQDLALGLLHAVREAGV